MRDYDSEGDDFSDVTNYDGYPETLDKFYQNQSSSHFFLSRNKTSFSNFYYSRHEIFIGVTLCNEPAEMLLSTLISIGINARRFSRHFDEIVVCVIADGIEKLHPSVVELMTQIGAYDDSLINRRQAGLDIFDVRLDLVSALQSAVNSNISDRTSRLLFCVKNENSGKLDSHWWLYKRICPWIDPTVCFQIDAGTRPESEALSTMYHAFCKNLNVGAVASSVRILEAHDQTILEKLQTFEFGLEKAVYWTSQALSGFLAVLPGQCSAFRWSAVNSEPEPGKSSPIDLYLRGLKSTKAYEKLMYLAEDRVLSFEIFAKKGSNYHIEYTSPAITETDACLTIDELMRQRRRWINSSLACRIWSICNIPRYLADSSGTLGEKFRFIIYNILLILQTFIELSLPLLNFILLYFSWNGINSMVTSSQIHWIAPEFIFTFIALLILSPLGFVFSNKLRAVSFQSVDTVMKISATAMLASLATPVVDSLEAFEALAVTILLFTVLPTIAGYAQDFRLGNLMMKNAAFFFLLAPIYFLMLYIYAYLNMNDDSWGTKNLKNKTTGHVAKKLSIMKWIFLFIWIIANITAGFLIVYLDFWDVAFKIIFGVICLIFISGFFSSLILNYRRLSLIFHEYTIPIKRRI